MEAHSCPAAYQSCSYLCTLVTSREQVCCRLVQSLLFCSRDYKRTLVHAGFTRVSIVSKNKEIFIFFIAGFLWRSIADFSVETRREIEELSFYLLLSIRHVTLEMETKVPLALYSLCISLCLTTLIRFKDNATHPVRWRHTVLSHIFVTPAKISVKNDDSTFTQGLIQEFEFV